MATGFEVAGLALALFPILVEALKFYAEEKGVAKDFLHYQHVLKRIVRDLGREQVTFRNSCQRFLEDLTLRSDLTTDEVDRMMRDPQHPRWTEGSWLRSDILDLESVQRFLETVEDMREDLAKISESVGVDQDTTPELLDRKTRHRQWKKLVFVINRDRITEHLKTASRLNTFLARLTDQVQPTAPTRRSRYKSTRHYKRIRDHAIDLYHTLRSKFPTPPTCNCMLNHEVNIRLEFRGAKQARKSSSFHTVFSLTQPASVHDPSGLWRELELEDWDDTENVLAASGHPKIPQQKTSSRFSSLLHSVRSPKQVVFAVNTLNTNKPSQSCAEIQDLCILVTTPTTSNDWLGFISNGTKRKHRLRDIQQPHVVNMGKGRPPTISLSRAFIAHKSPSHGLRSKLGLKLASSVMQLHSSHWLSDTWDAQDILLLQQPDGTVKVTDPFIQLIFGANDPSRTEPRRCAPSIIPAAPCLFALGIVLIELWHWMPFAQLKTNDERSMAPPEISDLVTAKRLIKSMDIAGAIYVTAVQRCVFGLDAACTSLGEDKFRDEVEEKIIFLLEEHLRLFCNKDTVEECF
ncbi:uncharacterized protein DSM5745_05036 [Aspergillus mulundensis]|uniref:DUF7580 domain-containing protein n=1 Tax=Aspergillus mulundensis TaxID=1810919 RepID=A0A3D8S5B7_9EURO|nr:hypothetical protein DSM5745_05036 [Aspergillus mulundensis]RDW81479.1 hypothetical protein DSM5745_05036 [Aspergillus mulundensis]